LQTKLGEKIEERCSKENYGNNTIARNRLREEIGVGEEECLWDIIL
jgi:hypothetical protein